MGQRVIIQEEEPPSRPHQPRVLRSADQLWRRLGMQRPVLGLGLGLGLRLGLGMQRPVYTKEVGGEGEV